MKVGMPLAYAGDFMTTVEALRDFEDAGVDIVLLPEAYGFDSSRNRQRHLSLAHWLDE